MPRYTAKFFRDQLVALGDFIMREFPGTITEGSAVEVAQDIMLKQRQHISDLHQAQTGVTWAENNPDVDYGAWECSGCGLEFCLEYDTPSENGMHFCPKCGHPITAEVRWGTEEGEPDAF